jgi:hypothetical protein
MAEQLVNLGFQSTMADPDVWLRAASKDVGEQYYEYVLMYVDDILAISCDPKAILEEVQKTFKLKYDRIEPPEFYLGAKLQEKPINGLKCWTITSQDYIKAAVKNVEEAIQKKGRRLTTTNVDTPMNNNYTPELDVTAELGGDDVTFYQELIGVLRWATETGRVDIILEVALLSQYSASPREGHLEQLLHIFAFLRKHLKLTLYLSPEMPMMDFGEFRTNKADFSELYRETSKFSSEFMALKVCQEAIEHMRFKLRCFGIPCPQSEPTYVYCDNESVVKNTTNVESTLNKKHSSIAYHG